MSLRKRRENGDLPTIKLNTDQQQESLPVIKNVGAISAEIYKSLLDKLRDAGTPMVLTEAEFEVQVRALVVDPHLFGDDDAHESVVILRGVLEKP